jgi:nucleoside 2-deoxyribosyltransferase
MKFYIAARFLRKDDVKNAHKIIKERGHEIAYDWTSHQNIMPFEENPDKSSDYASKDIKGVLDSDVFIALCDKSEGSTGMHTEIGAAMVSFILRGKPLVYIVGKENSKAMFYFHPASKRFSDLEEVLSDIGKLEHD